MRFVTHPAGPNPSLTSARIQHADMDYSTLLRCVLSITRSNTLATNEKLWSEEPPPFAENNHIYRLVEAFEDTYPMNEPIPRTLSRVTPAFGSPPTAPLWKPLSHKARPVYRNGCAAKRTPLDHPSPMDPLPDAVHKRGRRDCPWSAHSRWPGIWVCSKSRWRRTTTGGATQDVWPVATGCC